MAIVSGFLVFAKMQDKREATASASGFGEEAKAMFFEMINKDAGSGETPVSFNQKEESKEKALAES